MSQKKIDLVKITNDEISMVRGSSLPSKTPRESRNKNVSTPTGRDSKHQTNKILEKLYQINRTMSQKELDRVQTPQFVP